VEQHFFIEIYAPEGIEGIDIRDCELPVATHVSGLHGKLVLYNSTSDDLEWGFQASYDPLMCISGDITADLDSAERQLRSLADCLQKASFPHRIWLESNDPIEFAWQEKYSARAPESVKAPWWMFWR